METRQQLESQEQDRQQSTPSNRSKVTLVPYVGIDGDWILSEDFLDDIFDKIYRQSLIKTTFWEDGVTDPSQFVKMMRNPQNQPVFFFEETNCVGFAWMSGLSSNYGFAHFCLFREVWGRNSREIGLDTLDYWFSWPGANGPLLDVIIGIMPGFNVRAHKYIEGLGMTRLGIIPGMFRDASREQDDAVIYYKTRE